MGLFGKKKNGTESCCEHVTENREAQSPGARVKVLGSGCAKCHALKELTVVALKELGIDSAVESVTDFAQIASYGVMTTPALVFDGKVLSMGKALKLEEVKALLMKARGL